jgi:hypothetical protein
VDDDDDDDDDDDSDRYGDLITIILMVITAIVFQIRDEIIL